MNKEWRRFGKFIASLVAGFFVPIGMFVVTFRVWFDGAERIQYLTLTLNLLISITLIFYLWKKWQKENVVLLGGLIGLGIFIFYLFL